MLGFKDMSTLVGHFVSSIRERDKKDRRDSREDERQGLFLMCCGLTTFNLVGHFVSSPRKREKKDRRDSRGDEREEHGRKRTGMKGKKQKK